MTLDGLMFYDLFSSPFVVGFARAKTSICPHIFDVFVMNELVKGELFEFIGHMCMNKWMVLCDLHQDWF